MCKNYQYILEDNGLNWIVSSVIHTMTKEILICRVIVNEQASDRVVIYDISTCKIDYIGLILGFDFS